MLATGLIVAIAWSVDTLSVLAPGLIAAVAWSADTIPVPLNGFNWTADIIPVLSNGFNWSADTSPVLSNGLIALIALIACEPSFNADVSIKLLLYVNLIVVLMIISFTPLSFYVIIKVSRISLKKEIIK